MFLYVPIQPSVLLWSETHMYMCKPIQCGIEHVANLDLIRNTHKCDRYTALKVFGKTMKYGNPWVIISKLDLHQVNLIEQLSFQSMFEKWTTLQETKLSLHQTQQLQPVPKPERPFHNILNYINFHKSQLFSCYITIIIIIGAKVVKHVFASVRVVFSYLQPFDVEIYRYTRHQQI